MNLDNRSLIRKLAALCLMPRVGWAGLRFARTGSQVDYWRHMYWIHGPRGIADIIIHKDKMIAYYCEQAFRLRNKIH